jgi:hypothetical protein
MRRYSDVCRKLQDDRDDLFSLFSHEQRAARDLTQELAAAREELARVKDDLEFARRAIKALQSSKTTSKEALCAIYLKAPHPSPLLPSPPPMSPPPYLLLTQALSSRIPLGFCLCALAGTSKALCVRCRRSSRWKKRNLQKTSRTLNRMRCVDEP